MKLRLLIVLFIALILFCSQGFADTNDDFGILMDAKGGVKLLRGEKHISVEVGLNLIRGDIIEIEKEGLVVIVSYEECQEWQLMGPDTINIAASGVASTSNKVSPRRQLPVCYSLDEFDNNESDVIGGITLRGIPKDPLASLRKEFKYGKASNSTLITIIMHDLKNGNIEKARPYFETLSQRLPGSKIVKAFSDKF